MDHDALNARACPAPVAPARRIESIDAIRGFALLGILIPNLMSFGWPAGAVFAPERIIADDPWTARGVWITEVFYLGKMMFLFATLFGAGVALYARKFDGPAPDTGSARRPPLARGAGLWYRRCFCLLAIGLVHAFGLWYGDILVWYALAGMTVLWWVRRARPAVLLSTAAFIYVIFTLISAAWTQLGIHMSGPDMMLGNPAAEFVAYTGTYPDALRARVFTLLQMYIFYVPTYLPALVGIMMGGIALLRTGWLEGARPARHYALFAIVSLALGLATTLGARTLIYTHADTLPAATWMSFAQLCGVPLSLGYAAAIIWCVKTGFLRPVFRALEAVGRLALSNYLLQTLICTTLFYGYGFGRFGTIGYPALFAVAGAVWVVNIVFSLLWVRRFRFGPAEWVWRSLTYLRPQPFLRESTP